MQSQLTAPDKTGIVAWFASNPVAANLLMVLILAAGITTALNLKIEGWPGFKPKTISVSVVYLSGSAKNSEEGVTIKLEEALQSVQGIGKMESLSDASGSRITIEKASGYNLDTLYNDIKSQLDSISTLPAAAEKPVITKEQNIQPAVTVHLYGEVGQDVLQKVSRQFRERLLANPEIDLVDEQGRQTPEITIQVNEARLQALNLTLEDIGKKIADSSLATPGGELFSPDGKIIIKADQQRYWLREFEHILIRETPSGERLTLADIARVQDGYEQSGILSRFNGQPAIGLIVQMRNKAGHVVRINEAVDQEVAQFRRTLPASISIEAWNDQSDYIQNRLGLLLKNGLMGMALVILVLSLFLNLRLALWVGVGLPVVFSGAMIPMGPQFFNMTLNDLTTFGLILVLGIVVDDAVVIGESVYSEQERHGASLDSTIRGAQRVTIPTVFGVLTTVASFAALILVKGDMGEVFVYFAYAAIFCLVFTLIESKLILPAHLASRLSARTDSNSNLISRGWGKVQGTINASLRYFTWHQYRRFLSSALKLRYATLMVMLALFIATGGMVLSGKIRMVFFPDIPDEFIEVQLTLEEQAGYGLLQRQAIMIEQAGLLTSLQMAEEYGLEQGPITQISTLTKGHKASVSAGLTKAAQRPFGTYEIAERWQANIAQLEAVSKLKFRTSWEAAPGLAIELRSNSPETLVQASQKVLTALARYQGLSAIQNSLKSGQAQVQLTLRPKGEALGLTVGMLARQIQFAYQGYEVQRLQRGQDEIKVKVRYPDNKRQYLDDLNNARIRLSSGEVVRLGTVASIKTHYVAAEIKRTDRQRVALITADVDKSSVNAGEILATLEQTLFPRLKADFRDLDIRIDGEAKQEQETTASMVLAFAAALFAIFALLAIPLKSYFQPLIIMMAIPFGIIGALLGHWLHGIELSVLSVFGIMALSGVVVNNSLLLVTRFNELRAEGETMHAALLDSACSRLRAVLITSLTTYIGLVPLIFETSTNAQFLIPAALAMGYGILFSAVITLVLIPVLMLITHDIGQIFSRGNTRQHTTVNSTS